MSCKLNYSVCTLCVASFSEVHAMGKRKIFNQERSMIRFGFYQGHSGDRMEHGLERVTLKAKNQLVFYCERSIKGRK